ncbi:MAG: basic amino acid ABC transporter substrate-binding protein [Firmicutes bacterium]|nr:basic amino acid ABC transporter substrate-binding protein [Bacillota bacterium]
MKKTGILLLVCALILGMAGTVVAKEVLRVGSDVAFPPFEYVDENTHEYTGFDMDMVRALAEEMGMEVEIYNVAWEGIIPGLLNGNYDLIASAMTITEERKMSVNFSDPYFNAEQVILVRINDDTIHGPDDLKGKAVAVQLGTTGDFVASDLPGLKKVARFAVVGEAIQELMNGNVAAVICDNLVAISYIQENPGKAKIVPGSFFPPEYYGFAINKNNPELLKKVNAALAELKANGTYDKIYNKWFGTN